MRHHHNYVNHLLHARFQFHKGTIETKQAIASDINVRHFNSIKVRLRPTWVTDKVVELRFQFHKGTIETVIAKPCNGIGGISIP